jgi:hypothetical protein
LQRERPLGTQVRSRIADPLDSDADPSTAVNSRNVAPSLPMPQEEEVDGRIGKETLQHKVNSSSVG